METVDWRVQENLRFEQRKKIPSARVNGNRCKVGLLRLTSPLLSALKVKLVRSTCGKSEEPHLQTR